MKISIVTALLNVAAVVQAIPVPADSIPGLNSSQLVDMSQLVDLNQLETPVKMLKPKYRTNAQRSIIRYPAWTLQAKGKGGGMSMDPNGQNGMLRIGAGMCSKCTLLSAHYRLVFPNGEEAGPKDGVYIHHMISFLSPKTSQNPIGGGGLGSGGIGGGAYFIDLGEDSGQTDTVFTSQDGKFESGYHITGAPSVTVSYDIVNYKDTARQLHLELEYEYVTGIVGMDAGHTLKSVTGSPTTNGKSISMPMRVSKDTTIMWARGHLHAGGVSMTMKVNSAVKCVSTPTYDSLGVITNMSLCPEIKLKAGDSMVIESVYDTKAHKLRESTDGSGHAAKGRIGGSDVMGMIAMSYTT